MMRRLTAWSSSELALLLHVDGGRPRRTIGGDMFIMIGATVVERRSTSRGTVVWLACSIHVALEQAWDAFADRGSGHVASQLEER